MYIEKHIQAGSGCDIAHDIDVSPETTVVLGDNVHIGPGVRIVGKGTVKFGDYSKVHGGCFITASHAHSIVEFGCNTWIGERSVLDGRGGLHAGHNVGVGIASHLYSHIAHGDTMAGCKLMSEKKLLIGDDAWFVGQCLVSPVNVGEKSVAMLGSCVTHDMLPNSIYAGVPAKDLTTKLGRPWEDRPIADRIDLFKLRLKEFCAYTGRSDADQIQCVDAFPETMKDDVSYFNVSTRTYTKKRTAIEVQFMLWLTSWKGRFVPEGNK